jgi:uncharacterized protein DUF6544
MQKFLTIVLCLLAAIVLIVVAIRLVKLQIFNNEVSRLFRNVQSQPVKIFRYAQLDGLPEPVQRYFRYALKDGQPYIQSIRLKHHGLFKIDPKKDYINITGEQYFSVNKPQFIWKGTTAMFTATDSFIDDKGSLKVSLFNVIKVVDSKGSAFDEGEMQRWLAESVWFPTNLLPSANVEWTSINDNSSKLSFEYQDISFAFIVRFNAVGEITEMETQRFMAAGKREPWRCKMANYKTIDGVKIPFSAEVIWKLQAGDYSYAKFEVGKIEYDIPEKF